MNLDLHVLRLTPHFYWPQLEQRGWPVRYDAIGGMQTQIYQQTLALSAARIAQTVLTLRIPGTPRSWQVDSRTIVRGVRIPVMPLRSRLRGMIDLNLSWALGVLRAMCNLPPVDIIHVHWSGVAIPPLLTWWLKKIHPAPLVATVHCSSLATYHPMSRLDIAQHKFARFVEGRALRSADHVVALTPRLVEILRREYPGLDNRMSVVPDAIDRRTFSAAGDADSVAKFKSRFGLPQDRPVIGYAGRVAREKGWRTLLQLAKLMTDRRPYFLVCGDGNERDLLEREVERNGLRSSFMVTGYLPHHQVAAAISACDVLLLTSRHEEFGSILLEAMSVGTPAVAFAVGGIPHVLADGAAGIMVRDGDLAAMVDAVNELLDSPARRERIRQFATAHVERNFDRAAATAKTLEIYRSLIEGDHARRAVQTT